MKVGETYRDESLHSTYKILGIRKHTLWVQEKEDTREINRMLFEIEINNGVLKKVEDIDVENRDTRQQD